MTMTTKKSCRQVLFTGNIVNDIASLKEKSGASSDAEVVRDAINLYKLLSKHNGHIFIIHNNIKQEVLLPRKKSVISNINKNKKR